MHNPSDELFNHEEASFLLSAWAPSALKASHCSHPFPTQPNNMARGTAKPSRRKDPTPKPASLRRYIDSTREHYRPGGTSYHYNRAWQEFLEYGDSLHKTRDLKVIAATDNVVAYLTYHANRKKRSTRPRHPLFNRADYDKVMAEVDKRIEKGEPEVPSSDRIKSIDTVISSILNKVPDDTRLKLQSSGRIKRLKEMIAPRRMEADRAANKEKVNPETEVFQAARIAQDMEKNMWFHARSTLLDASVCLRNRYCFLDTLQSLVRGESLWKCTLSDHDYFCYPAQGEPTPYQMLFRTIHVGKTNSKLVGKPLTGRSMRHKDPTRCCHGGLALYLMGRFSVTKETFDLESNDSWFDVKTVVAMGDNARGFDGKKSLSAEVFTRSLKRSLEETGNSSRHTGHFGRSQGPGVLEMEECPQYQVRMLGNWGHDVYDKHYSGRMPLQAMRISAGYKKDRGSYYLPRSIIIPPRDLCKGVYPNITQAGQDFLRLSPSVQRDRVTARKFLHFMDYMAVVAIQDAAWFITHGRAQHPIFQMPFFRTDAFRNYTSVFAQQLATLELPANDPTVGQVKNAIPAVGHCLEQIQAQNRNIMSMSTNTCNQVVAMAANVNNANSQQHNQLANMAQCYQQMLQCQQQVWHAMREQQNHMAQHASYMSQLAQGCGMVLMTTPRPSELGECPRPPSNAPGVIPMLTPSPNACPQDCPETPPRFSPRRPTQTSSPGDSTTDGSQPTIWGDWDSPPPPPRQNVPDSNVPNPTNQIIVGAPPPIVTTNPGDAAMCDANDAGVMDGPWPPANYTSVQKMIDDWEGNQGSVFFEYGGIKNLLCNKKWKPDQAVKKRVQRLKRINGWVQKEREGGNTDPAKYFSEIYCKHKNNSRNNGQGPIIVSLAGLVSAVLKEGPNAGETLVVCNSVLTLFTNFF